ncbi:MAG: cardiolipin synthase [Bacteroidia bacterium]|nr:cardiolipin synthase [Bacteroidia bacterium]
MHLFEKYFLIGLACITYAVSIAVCLRILLENRNPAKTTSYILIILFFPILGLLVYFFFGINFRTKRKFESMPAEAIIYLKQFRADIIENTRLLTSAKSELLQHQVELTRLLLRDAYAGLTANNTVDLLINGENKFDKLLHDLIAAQHHIHFEYYIVENDIIGQKIKNILIQKSLQGVEVRFIYDDFGAKAIEGKYVNELRNAGVKIYPFSNINFTQLANRINYRNHRKIIVIDGKTGYTGGINISDRYINPNKNNYWRDTHLRITGDAVYWLQAHFILHYNFSSKSKLTLTDTYFPAMPKFDGALVQIAASGPDSERATLMLAFFTAIVCATKRVYITTPYLIPNESIVTALKQAVLSGLDVRLLVPKNSDSFFVNAASQSFYNELLDAGVKIYQYYKGFIHAKTVAIDNNLAIVGTANMDIRSFDLNFEINAFVYNETLNKQLTDCFLEDLKHSTLIDKHAWKKRKKRYRLVESVARLVAPLL